MRRPGHRKTTKDNEEGVSPQHLDPQVGRSSVRGGSYLLRDQKSPALRVAIGTPVVWDAVGLRYWPVTALDFDPETQSKPLP